MKLNIMKTIEIISRNNLLKSESNGQPYSQILYYCSEHCNEVKYYENNGKNIKKYSRNVEKQC